MRNVLMRKEINGGLLLGRDDDAYNDLEDMVV